MINTHAAEVCALCGEPAASTSIVDYEFDYRDGAKLVKITARVPVTECRSCEEDYFGEGAEDIKHEAVCRYLGRLTPNEIVAIRKRQSLSQAQLAELTGIGIASIKRWETGLVIQGAALDRQLRNLESTGDIKKQSPWSGQFRTDISENMRRRAVSFSLRPKIAQVQREAAICM